MGFETMWSFLSSFATATIVAYTILDKFFPPYLRVYVEIYVQKVISFLSPYHQIKFPQFSGERLKSSEAFTLIQTYLSETSSHKARKLKAEAVKNNQSPVVLCMDDNEQVTDDYKGVKLWWASHKVTTKSQSLSFYYPVSDEKRFYTLSFHKRDRDLIVGSYIPHVFEQGKAMKLKNRQLKLHTNSCNIGWGGSRAKWNHVTFEHPARFETLALEPNLKEEIIDDLIAFQTGKELYYKYGKAWKRGYLLYGPPGTGKSTLIAAMANFLNYDIYDLELTAVKDNTQLRTLLIETTSKSIIVIEDIDCSLDLTGKRKMKKEKDEAVQTKDPMKKAEEEANKESKVTLSGLLNCIDGIWSGCAGERIIVFTTNHVDKLDHALIRSGRMDKKLELPYCRYEAFKVLAKNYLDVDSHPLFPIFERLLKETNMTPADVAECLIRKSKTDTVETCLNKLIESLEKTKKKKAEEEAQKEKEKEQEEEKTDEKPANGVEENGSIH